MLVLHVYPVPRGMTADQAWDEIDGFLGRNLMPS